MFRILANLEFGEGLEQSSLSEHGEDGLLRVVDQFFKIALNIGTHEAAMGNSSSERPGFGIGCDRAVDVPQGDLCYWSGETHATGLAIWDRRSLLWTSGTRSLRTKLGFAPRLFANSAEERWADQSMRTKRDAFNVSYPILRAGTISETKPSLVNLWPELDAH